MSVLYLRTSCARVDPWRSESSGTEQGPHTTLQSETGAFLESRASAALHRATCSRRPQHHRQSRCSEETAGREATRSRRDLGAVAARRASIWFGSVVEVREGDMSHTMMDTINTL